MATRRLNALAGSAVVVLALMSPGCRPENMTAAGPSVGGETALETVANRRYAAAGRRLVTGQTNLTVVAGLTLDANGIPVVPAAVDPTTPLYYARTGAPILAPDGRHITAGEFSAVTGSISVRCVDRGTQINMHLEHLIPRATYRIWLLKFKAPGFSIGPPPDFSNLIGEGALGPEGRSSNTFAASASGQGQITRVQRPGPLSETLPVPPFANEPAGRCLLTDEFEWHVVGAFQQPGQPAGPNVGPPALFPGSAVEQFVFIFRRSP